MRKLTWLIIAACAAGAIWVACDDDDGVGPAPQPKVAKGWCERLPFDVGNKWTYDYLYDTSGNVHERGDYAYEISSQVKDYLGFEGYTIRVQGPNGYFQYMVGGADGDRAYLFKQGYWYFVTQTDMPVNSWAEAGFVSVSQLQLVGLEAVDVPVGHFDDCYKLHLAYPTLGGGNVSVDEYYATGVGMVMYKQHYTQGNYWATTQFQLKSYEINHID